MLRLRLIENCCGETIAEAGLDPKPLTILGSRLGGSEKTKGDAETNLKGFLHHLYFLLV